jgi:quercetin dioxygenase-like cupin family protein
MRRESLDGMERGWLIGNFSPSVYETNDVEVAVKRFRADDYEEWHYHKVATEITTIVSGEVEMNHQRFQAGDIIVLDPEEGSDFRAITDTVVAVVKIPGANNDKYLRGGRLA